jgi:hypothetical protein
MSGQFQDDPADLPKGKWPAVSTEYATVLHFLGARGGAVVEALC